MYEPDTESLETLSEIIYEKLKYLAICPRIKQESAFFLSGALDYLLRELISISTESLSPSPNAMLDPTSIQKAISNDHDFSILLRNVFLNDALISHNSSQDPSSQNFSYPESQSSDFSLFN